MAHIIYNPKGFKVIACSAAECFTAFGGYGICDQCNSASATGYYVAVLNHWLCQKCYEEWSERAINYPEDATFEQRNYDYYKTKLHL